MIKKIIRHMGLNCVHWSPDLDVAGSTSVKQGTDENFQDWNMSGGSLQSQPEGKSHAAMSSKPACWPPQALSASVPALQWLGLQHLALNHQWSCWGSMKVDKKGLQIMFIEQCPSVLWYLPSMVGLLLLPPAVPVAHSRQQSSLTHPDSTDL